MKTMILLAMHGMPPKDFPKDKMALWSQLHRLPAMNAEQKQTYETVDREMRHWQRTPENDAFYFSSFELAKAMKKNLKLEVVVGFNEFTSPTLDEAFEQALKQSPQELVVITPMLMRGGSHSETDIPQSIARAQQKYPNIPIRYAWPFTTDQLANFFSAHANALIKK